VKQKAIAQGRVDQQEQEQEQSQEVATDEGEIVVLEGVKEQ
jgi:hypothetical protein